MHKKLFKSMVIKKTQLINIGLIVALAVVAVINVPPAAQMVFNTYTSAQASQRKLPIYSVDTPDKKVAISFDAAWGADDTDKLLQILKDNDAKATFFLCGYWVEKYPDEVVKIVSEGHDIGNHGNTHAHGAQLSLEQNKAEIMKCHEKIKEASGVDSILFRPPFGEYNNTVITAAEESGYYVIQWDVDTLDTKIKVVESLILQAFHHFYF